MSVSAAPTPSPSQTDALDASKSKLGQHFKPIYDAIKQAPSAERETYLRLLHEFTGICDDLHPESTGTTSPATRARPPTSPPPNASNTTKSRNKRPRPPVGEEVAHDPSPSPSSQHSSGEEEQVIKRAKTHGALTTITSPDLFQRQLPAMTAQYSSVQVQSARDQFYQNILRLTKSSGTLLFSERKAAQLTAFFFEQTQGPQPLQRLVSFIRAYRPRGNKPGVGASVRAKMLSRDESMPTPIRLFFAAYHLSRSTKGSSNKIVDHVAEVVSEHQTLRRYYLACREIDNQNPHTVALCRKYRLQTSTSRRNASVAIDLLSTIINLPRNTFIRSIDRVKGINLVAEKFGDTFILLTPPKSMSFLQKMSLECLGPACNELLKICPYIRPICEKLDEALWQPYINCHSQLPIKAGKLEEVGNSWLEQFENAVIHQTHPSSRALGDRTRHGSQDEANTEDSSDGLSECSQNEQLESDDSGEENE